MAGASCAARLLVLSHELAKRVECDDRLGRASAVDLRSCRVVRGREVRRLPPRRGGLRDGTQRERALRCLAEQWDGSADVAGSHPMGRDLAQRARFRAAFESIGQAFVEDPPPAREQTRVRRVVDEGVSEPPAVAVVRRDQRTRGELFEGIGRERVVEQCLDRR